MATEEEKFDDLDMSSLMQEDDINFLTDLTSEDTSDPDETDPAEEVEEEVDEEESVASEEETSEEESEEDESEEEDEESEDKGTPSHNTNPFFSFASALQEEGVLDSSIFDDKTKVESAKDLIDLVEKQVRKNEFAGLNDVQKRYLDNLSKGFSPEEFFRDEQEQQTLESITKEQLEENEDLRRQLIYQDYLQRGYNENRADKLTQRSFDNGEDVEDAELALETRKERVKTARDEKIANREKEIEQAKKSQAEKQKAIKKEVFDEEKEIIPGIRNTSAIATRVFEAMTKPVKFTDDGRPMNKLMAAREEDPIAFEHALYFIFEISNGFKDFSKITKTSKTKAVNQLDKVLSQNTFNPGGQGPRSKGDDKFLNSLEALERSLNQ